MLKSRLLYLSDSHFGSTLRSKEIGDFSKSNIVPENERPRTQNILEQTLLSIPNALQAPIDALVVNGDLNDAGGSEGYAVLENLAKSLKLTMSQTVVVPGNHDVHRDTNPSSVQKYPKFKEFITRVGCIAPAIEGIDINAENGSPIDLSSYKATNHFLLDSDFRWVVIPINCANYYGTVEPLDGMTEENWAALQEEIQKGKFGDPKETSRYLTKLRRRDAARVTPAQFRHVETLVNYIDNIATSKTIDPRSIVRIGVIHHQLLPVSEVEELKPFEVTA